MKSTKKAIKQKTLQAEIADMITPLKARTCESGSDMIRNYGKIEAVVEMYQDGTVDPGKALKRIIEIVKGK